MAKTTYAFKLDNDLKIDLENICDEFGINLSTFFTMAAKKLVRERKIEFDLSDNFSHFYSKENLERLLKAKEQIEKSGGTIHEVL